jgi:hypothetical protein
LPGHASNLIITSRKIVQAMNSGRPPRPKGLEMKTGTLTLVCASSLASASTVSAHHSASAFDRATQVDFEGTIVELEWKNPHIYFTIETTDADGRNLLQQVEVGPISGVQTFGLTKDVLTPGSKITVRANPNRRRGLGGTVRGLDVTTSDGAIYPLVITGRSSAPPVAAEVADTLAGRWAVTPAALRALSRDIVTWPFTDAGRKALAEVSAGAIESQAGCPEYPPPMLDDLPSVREIEVGEEKVRIRFDTGGVEAVRTIHLDRSSHPANVEVSLLGHSIGRWEGKTLVVNTVAFAPNLRGVAAIGVPSGPGKRMTERFALAEDGLSLRRETTIEDPDYLAAPVSYVMVWDHRPELDFSSASETCDPEIANRFLEDL